MLTTKVQKNLEVALKYFNEHLKPDEYYLEEGDSVSAGKWEGEIAKKFGIHGKKVEKTEFENLLRNHTPDGKSQLTQRTKAGRRLYFDAVMSAPKSVSILGLTMGDSRLIQAHEKAVSEAIQEMESFAQTRVRKNGQNTIRRTNNFLSARFTHQTSRANDPQLHTHNLIFNVTFDELEGKYKALEAYSIYDYSNYLTQVYRNKLAKEVLNIGYKIKPGKYGFEIDGVSEETLELFSKRSSDIKKQREKLEEALGRDLTNNELSHVSHQTRDSKDYELSPSEAIKLQREQLTKIQEKQLQNLVSMANESKLKQAENENNENEAIEFALKKNFERKTTLKIYDVLSDAIKFNYGNLDLPKLRNCLFKNKELSVDLNNEKLTSWEQAELEVKILKSVSRGIGKSKSYDEPSDLDFSLDFMQNRIKIEILKSNNRINVLRGVAGAGKSHLISKIVEEVKDQKIPVFSLAPTGGAVENLSKDLNVDSQTIQSFLRKDNESLNSLKSSFVIVDEAGMLSYKQLDKLLKISEEQDFKVLLSGDTRQNHSIEAGDALRLIEDYSTIEVHTLDKVRRQNSLKESEIIMQRIESEDLTLDEITKLKEKLISTEYYRQFSEAISKKQVLSAFNTLDKMGALKEVETFEEKSQKISNEFVESLKDGNDVQIVTITNREKDTLNLEVREHLIKDGYLKSKKTVEKVFYKDLSLTTAEKENLNRNFSDEKENLFLKLNTKHDSLSGKEFYQIQNVDGVLIVANKDQQIPLNTLRPEDFNVSTKQVRNFCEGEHILIKEKIKLDQMAMIS